MRFNWWEYLLKHFDYDTGDLITDAIWRQGYWNELDRGVWTVEQVHETMASVHPEVRQQILQALDGVGEACHRHDYAIPWIRQLKAQGYQVLFLSNYSDWLIERNPEVLDFLPYTDGGIFSCRVKLTKPDPAIYQKLCDTYGLQPEECVFVDDNADNIASANRFGIHAFRFLDYDQSYPVIMQYLAENGLAAPAQ